MYIQRDLEKVLEKRLFKGKVLVLYGPRQAGKTTLVKHLVVPHGDSVRFIDCELLENRELLTRRRAADLFSLVRQYKVVVFDEAQVIKDIGSILKTLFDHHPEVQYIATGSSSFDLANSVSEPLTGRSLEFTLYPISLTELAKQAFDAEHALPTLMRFGGYPDMVNVSEEEKVLRLKTLVSQYLYKNVLAIANVRKPELITHLLRLLAYQVGNEVSCRELAEKLKTSPQTIERYIDLLEKNFVIVRLGSFARNLRNEVTTLKKIYFWDNGIRNALIDSFAPIDPIGRNDVGALFENTMIVERLKFLSHAGKPQGGSYFWRTFTQKEIDYVEEYEGKIGAYEFKWNRTKVPTVPHDFKKAYPHATFTVVSPQTAYGFVVGEGL
ncbi:MAG: ATP-binding protein [bacterium]|nr:ATP-binding protein [bacterium]